MTIFVTGGAGYIGSHVVIELLEQGHNVVVADNFSNSKRGVIERICRLAGREFPFYEMDIRDADGLGRIFSEYRIDSIIHLAGLKAVGESVSKPLEYYANNLESTMVLIDAMKTHNVKKFIFSSSATVYSADNEMPLTEESRTGGCTNPYGWTKFMCEQILCDYANAANGCAVVLLRYFNPIGAHPSGLIGEDPQDIPNNLMPYIAQTAAGRLPFLSVFGDDYDTPDGTCVRDYIHVSDLAAGHVAAIKHLDSNSGVSVFNLGTGKGVSVLEFVAAFEEATGVSIPKKTAGRRSGDLPLQCASTEKAKRELGWEAKRTLYDACVDTWRWQKGID
ncbi:MAG: UDP-glucose 4-epimerase GalE [Oscillospiraceae bacterium]|nr:UDP-glucose 4-epimerase GalE [Oscillospiraceae bacterium]